MQLVHLLIAHAQGTCGRGVALVPAVRGLAPHPGGQVSHPLDEPPAARREVIAENVVGPGADLHHAVVGALEFGQDPQHGEQEAQVISDGCLQQDLPVGQLLDLRVQGADELLALGQHREDLAVAGQQGVGRPGEILGDHGEHLDDLGLDGLKLTLEFLPALAHDQNLLRFPG